MVQFLSALIYFLLLIMSIFLICLVLIQRGKGGGLAGAFGGAGSSSAFGSKAGDVFTRVTMVSAGIWIALNMVLVILSNQRTSAWSDTPTPGSASKSTFTPNADKKDATGKAPSAPTSTAPGSVPNGADALAPANPNAPSPSPLGKGGTTPIKITDPPAAKSELPDPFSPGSPTPAGSTPSGPPGNPKP